MRRAAWAVAGVLAGVLVGVGGYAAFRVAAYDRLPRVAEMTAACARAAGAVAPRPAYATPARCRAYFADLGRLRRTAVTQSVATGLVVAFVLLVWRFRVRPPGRPSRPDRSPPTGSPPPAPPPHGSGRSSPSPKRST